MSNVKDIVLHFLKRAKVNKSKCDYISFREKARLKKEEEGKRENILKKAETEPFDKETFLKEAVRRKKSEEKNNEYLRSIAQLREETRITKEQCQNAYDLYLEQQSLHRNF